MNWPRQSHNIGALEPELAYRDPGTIAAVIMEPVQAAGGVYPPPDGYLSAVREACDRHDVLFVLAEAQRRIQSAGVLVRAQADHLGIYPPFTFTTAEVDRVVEAIGTVLGELS